MPVFAEYTWCRVVAQEKPRGGRGTPGLRVPRGGQPAPGRSRGGEPGLRPVQGSENCSQEMISLGPRPRGQSLRRISVSSSLPFTPDPVTQEGGEARAGPGWAGFGGASSPAGFLVLS